MKNPFQVAVYDKHFQFQAMLNDYQTLTVTPRHNKIGTADIVVKSDHRRLPLLAAKGARVVIRHNGEHLMSGPMPTREGSGPKKAGLFTFHVRDDLWLLWRMLGWPVPGSPINAQGVKSDSRSGPAESVVKAFVTANKAHLIDAVTVAPDLGRGTSIPAVESRMAILGDILMTPVDQAGIGVTVRQSGAGLLVDCYEPRVFTHTLTEQSGTIINWSWSQSDEETTVAIVGGPNENTSREFRRVADSTRETDLNYTIESFVDARSADTTTKIDAAGTQALADAGPKAGFSVELSESKHFRYGSDGVRVGDQVTIDVGGQTITDILREATIKVDRDSGISITPAIGERTEDPNRALVSFINTLARGIRALRTR